MKWLIVALAVAVVVRRGGDGIAAAPGNGG